MRFFATALLLACGSPDTTSVPPITSGPGRILGTISTFGEGELLHVVPGARVSVAGIEATADQYGRFAIEGVPTDMPIAVTVRGPDAERYADNRIIVNVPSESGAISADFHLLAACEAGFDGTIGGSIGCDDRAAIEFTPGSVGSTSVIATIAALDPVHVVDRLGFPGSDEQVSVMGGISVELHDGNDGRPLELEMPVNVRFELAAGEGEVELQWFDGESWIAQPNGTIAIEGERRFYRFEAAHFSSYRAVVTRRYPPNACITFDTAICAQPGCERTVWVSMVDLINQRVTRGYFGPSDVCIPAYSSHAYQLYFTHVDLFGIGPQTPVHQTTRRVAVPPAVRTGHECIADCTDLGRVELVERVPGCVTGTLLTPCGLGCAEPYAGPLDVSFEGQRVATIGIPPECGGDVCIPVPISPYGGAIDLRTPQGHRLSFAPDVSSRGKACDPFACAPSPDCQELGATLLGCGNGLAECLEAKFSLEVRESWPGCGSDRPHSLSVDASATVGRAAGYLWTIDRDDGTTVETELESLGRAQFCLEKGTYRVTLRANTNNTFSLPTYSWASQDADVGVGLIELSIDANPGTLLQPGMPVTLTAITPDDPSQYEYFWWRGVADDPSYAGDTVSVTVTPRRAREAFGVFVSKNGVRVGSAQIVIEVDTSLQIYVEVDISDIRPNPDQPVTFRPMTIAGGMRDIVSCLYTNVTAIRWRLTDTATGQTEDTVYEAPAGSVLACDMIANVDRRFYAGWFRMELTVETDDGRTGSASLDFEVAF